MRSKYGGSLAATTTALLIIGFTIFMTSVNADSSQTIPDDINAVLSDYSQFIETGNTSQEAIYSSQMIQLAAERQTYYQEFLNKGLHSDLVYLESQFITEKGVTISLSEETYSISIAERVTLHGKPITISTDDYPLIQAAKWALAHTSDTLVKKHLNELINSMSVGVRTSIENGFEVVFIVRHKIVFERMEEQNYIIKDTFSDEAKDNAGGFDKISWTENGFVRSKPNWLQFPDYEMYHTPIDVIGRSLLLDFQAVSKTVSQEKLLQSDDYTYDRVAARTYISEYTSNPDYYEYCNWENPHVVLRESEWNPEYEYLWGHESMYCKDCADYVSQALLAGGLPTNDDWWPALVEAWVRVLELKEYLENTNKGIMLGSYWSLQIGDLGFKYNQENVNEPWEHVVMLSYVNPHLFSAHTNDRRNYTFSSIAFNKYMQIFDQNPFRAFIPLIMKSESSIFGPNQSPSKSAPYPAPLESLPTVVAPYP